MFGALAVLVVTQERATRRDLAEIHGAMGGEIRADLRGARGDIAEISGEIRAMTNRMAYLHGYLSGTATREIQEGEPGTESGS